MNKLSVLLVVLAVIGVALASFWNYVTSIYCMVTLLIATKLHGARYKNKYYAFADDFEALVDKSPSHVQLIRAETGATRTLKQTEEWANQFAHWAMKRGIKRNDTVCLMACNSLDYPCIWIGLSKIGAATALINNNITGRPMTQTIETTLASTETKVVIVDPDIYNNSSEEIAHLTGAGIQVYVWDGNSDGKLHPNAMNSEVLSNPKIRPSRDIRKELKETDSLIFIYTSGTTGLPKACKISQTRFRLGCYMYPCLLRTSVKDTVYAPLPLYHSAGGLLAFGGSLTSGATMVIRKKFSASNFSSDCFKYKVTVFQYIGELFRYLTNCPPNAQDEQLKIRLVFGNGMRLEYWEKFLQRYKIPHIVEFYAATEGNVTLFNPTGQVGALGFFPVFADFIYPLRLIRVDPDDPSKPLKDENGNYSLCKPFEVGLLLSEISQTGDASRRFEGYSDSKATNAKILRDVFRNGDMYFNRGDLLYRDRIGHYYWADRVGDTFRWKGENCSTTEVSQVISNCNTVQDVVVYAVSVPNTDGKAGMAGIVTTNEDNTLDFKEFVSEVSKNLPPYARPLFLRIKVDRKLPVTTTHKYIKADLVKEVSGFSKELMLIVEYILNVVFQ